jgi:phage virion morphogenesis protein
MPGRLIEIDESQLQRLIRKVQTASREDMHGMLDAIGQTAEDHARKRILQTKRAPDGESWKPWSSNYAKFRGRQKKTGSLLHQTGELARRMTHQVDDGGDSVEVGSNMIYAGAMQYGYGKIPARPYLDTQPGFADSAEAAEIKDIVSTFLGELLT